MNHVEEINKLKQELSEAQKEVERLKEEMKFAFNVPLRCNMDSDPVAQVDEMCRILERNMK